MSGSLIAVGVLAVLVIIVIIKTAVIVPQKNEFIIERLGKYRTTIGAGFHVLFPFIDKVAYKFSLKEEVMDIPSQTCITKDNVTVEMRRPLSSRLTAAHVDIDLSRQPNQHPFIPYAVELRGTSRTQIAA